VTAKSNDATGTSGPAVKEAAIAVVRRLYAAYNAYDLDAVIACWQPGGIEYLPLAGEMTVPDDLRPHLTSFYGAFPDAKTELLQLVADDNGRVATQIRLSGTFSGTSFNGLRANGKSWITLMAEFFVTEGGLITRMDAYMDSMDLARQLTILPPEGSSTEKVLRATFNLKVAIGEIFSTRPSNSQVRFCRHVRIWC